MFFFLLSWCFTNVNRLQFLLISDQNKLQILCTYSVYKLSENKKYKPERQKHISLRARLTVAITNTKTPFSFPFFFEIPFVLRFMIIFFRHIIQTFWAGVRSNKSSSALSRHSHPKKYGQFGHNLWIVVHRVSLMFDVLPFPEWRTKNLPPPDRFVPSHVYNFVNAPHPARFALRMFGTKGKWGICAVKILVFAIGKKNKGRFTLPGGGFSFDMRDAKLLCKLFYY